jgi:putative transposase
MSAGGMPTPPSLIRPNATYAICRRIEGRRLLLRPDERLNLLFIWVLAIVSKRHGVVVHVATVMSTHYPLVVSVPDENVSEFAHDLNMLLANALRVLRKFVRASYGSGVG